MRCWDEVMKDPVHVKTSPLDPLGKQNSRSAAKGVSDWLAGSSTAGDR